MNSVSYLYSLLLEISFEIFMYFMLSDDSFWLKDFVLNIKK